MKTSHFASSAADAALGRRIARELDIDRETVGKYLRLVNSKPAVSTPGSTAGRQSLCQPHLPQIEVAVMVGLSAPRVYQDSVCDHGFLGSYQAVKRFVRQLRQGAICADGSGTRGRSAGGFWSGRVGDGGR
jgi:hypothetical protein